MAYVSMPREAFPEVVTPEIYVGTPYPGNSPVDIEKLITRPIEKEIKTISGIDKLTSNSIQGYSSIRVVFDFSVSPEKALQKVKDAVDKAKSSSDFPTDLPMDPNVFEMNFSELTPVMNVYLSGDFSADLLEDYAEIIEDKIEALPQVTKVDIRGIQEKEVKINVDVQKMESMNISFNDIENAVAYENTASKELALIRQSLSKKRQDLNRVFNKLILKYQKLGLLSDITQSIRHGRRVLGIVAESKRQIQGIIHDESDTGKTVFLEPGETTELNNSIFHLEREEERELYRILRELTRALSEYQPLIADYFLLLSTLDMIQAKAKYALDLGASYPVFKNTTEIKLRKAFHPLLLMHNKAAKKDTIPLDLHLHQGQHILVISGPNAGGKTICLKTVALLQLMLQAGFLIPVDEQSEMGIFKQLFLDIGDAQSIEYELSTYSSHLKSMKYFVDFSNNKTLFLIDELGSGTDPALGGAFAEVILEKLAQEKAYGVVTTHYLNLKVMADKVKGVINGAMAFDEVNLLPLYRLSVGKPGSSPTCSIAQRSGLPKA